MKVILQVGAASVSCETDYRPDPSAKASENDEARKELFTKLLDVCITQLNLWLYKTPAEEQDNAQQIDNTDYYRLPCGMYLEDYIRHMRLDFATGSALKYLWRAGHKDGESAEKDMAKAAHYIRFMAQHDGCAVDSVTERVHYLLREAAAWNGKAVQR